MKISMVQMNPIVTDIGYNFEKIFNFYQEALHDDTDLVVFPELCTTGYIPEDLFWNDCFQQQLREATYHFIQQIGEVPVFLPSALFEEGGDIYNGISIIQNKKEVGRFYKTHLPNKDVFYEKRWFTKSLKMPIYWQYKNKKIFPIICEDIWHPHWIQKVIDYNGEVPDYFIIVNASPFREGFLQKRYHMLKAYQHYGIPIFYLNQCGGHDELVFDGGSMVINQKGNVVLFMDSKEICITIDTKFFQTSPISLPSSSAIGYMGTQIKIGIEDYIHKNGFKQVLVGISGGIDSAVVATLATDVLGKNNVIGVMMPSKYTSEESLEDGKALIHNLGIESYVLPIHHYMQAMQMDMEKNIVTVSSLVLENIQSRIRGMFLMTLSNAKNALVLTTGNKSELAVGYATLYGDMCGAYNPLKDLLKTKVYQLAYNLNDPIIRIPERILTKEPSAELSENQKDTDQLPPYADLDPFIDSFIQPHAGCKGNWNEEQRSIYTKYRISEYKRYQATVGPKLTQTAFGGGRKIPVTLRFFMRKSKEDKFP